MDINLLVPSWHHHILQVCSISSDAVIDSTERTGAAPLPLPTLPCSSCRHVFTARCINSSSRCCGRCLSGSVVSNVDNHHAEIFLGAGLGRKTVVWVILFVRTTSTYRYSAGEQTETGLIFVSTTPMAGLLWARTTSASTYRKEPFANSLEWERCLVCASLRA